MTRWASVLATSLVLLAAPSARAALPAPGSAYHLLFASSNSYRTTSIQGLPPPALRFGNIAGADFQVTNSAANALLPGTLGWQGVVPIYRAILSITGDNARDRLSVSGPVFNLHGTELASGHADLFDGSLAAAVDYDELGTLITEDPDVWTGSTAVGTAGGGFSCGTWNNTSSVSGGRTGIASESGNLWISTGSNKPCNQSARLYALSPALTAPLWGDYDGSGTVDGGDFLLWQRELGQPPSAAFLAARSFAIGLSLDTGQPAPVGADDLAVWRDQFGQTLPTATAVPEPGSFVLAIAAALGVGYGRATHRPSLAVRRLTRRCSFSTCSQHEKTRFESYRERQL